MGSTVRWDTRGKLLCVAVALFLGIVIGFAGRGFAVASLVIATDGLSAALWIAGATALGALILRPGFVDASPPLRVATAAAIGLGLFSLLGLGLGLVGRLNRPVALALPIASATFWAISLAWRHRRWLASARSFSDRPVRDWVARPAGVEWLWLIPVFSLALACVGAAVLPGLLWKPLDPHPYDVVSYHLQVPREWFEAGRIVPLKHNVFSYFPFNVETQFLLAMHAAGGPWAAMYFCQFINVGLTVLMVLALAGAAPGRGGVVAAAVTAAVPWVVMLACVAYAEAGLLLYSTLALIWVLPCDEHLAHASESMSKMLMPRLMLAGVFAGLAAGVKITAVPMLILPIAIGLPIVLRGKLSAKSIALGILAFLTAAGVVLSPWLIRNIVWAGNPIFPLAMNLLGRAHFTPTQVERFRIAHSPQPGQTGLLVRLQILWTGVLAHWQYGFILLPLGAIAAARRTRATALLWINAIVVLVVWLGFTHLLPRFAISLVPVAALALGRVRWQRMKWAGVSLALVAATVGLVPTAATLHEQIKFVVDNGLFGMNRLDFPTTEDAHRLDPADTKSVALVGDAAAFLVQIPMTRLHYRTVFDLPGNVTDPVDAWAGQGVRGNPDWLLAIDPAEIARLHATYYAVPALPPDYAGLGDRPGVVPALTLP